MLQNRLVIKLLAFIFLVLLSPKIGFGIYFHTANHIQASTAKCDKPSIGITNYHCNCIDDFSMPFTGTDAFVALDNNNHFSNFLLSPTEQLPVYFQFFNSLRAPPTI